MKFHVGKPRRFEWKLKLTVSGCIVVCSVCIQSKKKQKSWRFNKDTSIASIYIFLRENVKFSVLCKSHKCLINSLRVNRVSSTLKISELSIQLQSHTPWPQAFDCLTLHHRTCLLLFVHRLFSFCFKLQRSTHCQIVSVNTQKSSHHSLAVETGKLSWQFSSLNWLREKFIYGISVGNASEMGNIEDFHQRKPNKHSILFLSLSRFCSSSHAGNPRHEMKVKQKAYGEKKTFSSTIICEKDELYGLRL